MNLPIASRVKVYLAKTSLHATIVIAASLLLLIGYAFNPRRPGGPASSEAHVGPNNAPIAVNDGPYTVHDHLVLPQIMTNDSDPDGDTFTFDSFGTMPAHGFPIIGEPPGIINFVVGQTPGYVGPDNFTYRLHDSHGALSNYATISINIVNEAPVAVNDEYVVRGSQLLLSPAVMDNDFDPDTGDHLSFDLILQPPSHGSLIAGTSGNFAYVAQSGFEGVDTFTYQITDHLGLRSSPGTVTLYVVDNADRLGPCHKRAPIQGPRVIGRPVDVTTGNMYVQQTDYAVLFGDIGRVGNLTLLLAGSVPRGLLPTSGVRPPPARITPGSLPASEEAAVANSLGHIDAGTTPTGDLAKKWGAQFKNLGNDLPGPSGPSSPYTEYRVAPPPGTSGAGPLRLVVNRSTGEVYYTWTHYGDAGAPAFVRVR